MAVSGALLGATLVTPTALLIVNHVCNPLDLPAVVGSVLGMAFASLLAFQLCRWFPTLVRGREVQSQQAKPATPAPAPSYGAGSTARETYGFEGGELDLIAKGARMSGLLSARKARILLWLLMGSGREDELEHWLAMI